jgi:hypothetical protein
VARLLSDSENDLEGFAVKANELLIWMSARGEGSWMQFRGAVEELHMELAAEGTGEVGNSDTGEFPIYQELRFNLQRLGHAEFYANGCKDGWRVAPPVLATMVHENGCLGILCGARSLGLLARFWDRAQGLAVETIEGVASPDMIRVLTADEDALHKLAADVGLLFQGNAAFSLLLNIPAIDLKPSWIHANLPSGRDWKVERFVPAKLGWTRATPQEALSRETALYRFTFRFQRSHYLCYRAKAFEVPAQIGKYIALRRSRRVILNYNVQSRELRIPAICRPPLLIERALTLCSGIAPVYDSATGMVSYRDVPQEVAHLTSQLLKQ